MAGCAVVVVKLDTKEHVFEVISSLYSSLLTHELFEVRYAPLVENKSLKVPFFKDWLPLPTDAGIAGAGAYSSDLNL